MNDEKFDYSFNYSKLKVEFVKSLILKVPLLKQWNVNNITFCKLNNKIEFVNK